MKWVPSKNALWYGAAALVLCSAEHARRLGARVKVASTVLLSGRDRNGTGPTVTERAAERAHNDHRRQASP